MKFLKGINRSAAEEQAFKGSRNFREILESSRFIPEPPQSPGSRVYIVVLEMILIPLATLKAACRNQASNLFLMIVEGSRVRYHRQPF
jgi:hypothetical protein